MNSPLYDAAGTQNFTFRRYKYMLDFSGFDVIAKFILHNIEFQCQELCSGIMLANAGTIFTVRDCFITTPKVRDCFITTPKDRGITSMGGGAVRGCSLSGASSCLLKMTCPFLSAVRLR